MNQKTKVLIINSNNELIEAIQEWLGSDGHDSLSLHAQDIKEGKVNLITVLNKYKPSVILYDISIPYEENWQFFKAIRNSKKASRYRFVLTTTNKKVLDELVGPNPAIEVIGKPFDLKLVTKLINKRVKLPKSKHFLL